MDIIQACNDPRLFKGLFKDPSTWRSWFTFFKAYFALETTRAERKLIKKCTGGRPPKKPIRTAFLVISRRGGKSFVSSLLAVHLAISRDVTPYLSAGERAYIFLIAVDKNQAMILKNYISGIMNSTPNLKMMISKDLQFDIELTNRVTISVKTCNFRAVRGFTLAGVISGNITGRITPMLP